MGIRSVYVARIGSVVRRFITKLLDSQAGSYPELQKGVVIVIKYDGEVLSFSSPPMLAGNIIGAARQMEQAERMLTYAGLAPSAYVY